MSKIVPQLWFAEATEAGCRVYAQCAAADTAEPEGWLQGPQSPYASTLQARYPLRRRPGALDGALEAWIDEPCFWTPAGPYLYRWEFRLPPAAALTGLLGIRRLSVRRDYLEFDLKRWVLRGAHASEPLAIGHWHEALLAPLVDNPSDETCDEASRAGVLLVARLTAGLDVGAELRRLAGWPAVGVAILDGSDVPDDPRHHAPNMIFGQWFVPGAALEPAAWARLLFCEVDESDQFARRVAGFAQPVVAVRRNQNWSSPGEARAACDLLQRDLAAAGVQMAGYLV